MIYYTGIGSRETPDNIMDEMSRLASHFASRGWTLRSGGADGADTAFEWGCRGGRQKDGSVGAMEIFLPWKRFNNNTSDLFDIPDAAYEITKQYHPAWERLTTPVRKLMARNAQQVLGKNLDSPSTFVVCWTPDGCTNHETRNQKTGGTGQAISIASESGIPVINLQTDDALDRIKYIIMELT